MDGWVPRWAMTHLLQCYHMVWNTHIIYHLQADSEEGNSKASSIASLDSAVPHNMLLPWFL